MFKNFFKVEIILPESALSKLQISMDKKLKCGKRFKIKYWKQFLTYEWFVSMGDDFCVYIFV